MPTSQADLFLGGAKIDGTISSAATNEDFLRGRPENEARKRLIRKEPRGSRLFEFLSGKVEIITFKEAGNWDGILANEQ